MIGHPMVVLLTAAGAGVGLGHLRRCQALAAALARDGATARLVVAGDAATRPGAESCAGAPVDWLREPARTLETLVDWRPDAVVVDTYAATTELLVTLAAATPRLAVIDDLADRHLPVSLVVNGGYAARDLSYRTTSHTTLLLGPEYALVGPEFRPDPARRARAGVQRILLALGGAASVALLQATLGDVRAAVPTAAIDVVVGPYTAGRLEGHARVTVHRGVTSLRALMLTADVAVVGGGVTLLECLASATPAIGVGLAENQRPNIEGLSRDGLILRGDPALGPALERLVQDEPLRQAMAERGRGVVDGRGAERVARALLGVPAAALSVKAHR